MIKWKEEVNEIWIWEYLKQVEEFTKSILYTL